MRRAIILCATGLAIAACGVQTALSATASIPVRVKFQQPAGINVGNQLTLPPVSVAPVAPTSSLSTGSVSAGSGATASGATGLGATGAGAAGSVGGSAQGTVQSGPTGNAQLTIRGQPGDVVSTTVPKSFTVVRNGGEETLTVQTNTNTEYQVGSGDVVLGDAILNSDTMSVDIGGALNLASADNLVPGPYEGLLVVVVQYN